MADDLTTDAECTWCPGCGNFGLFEAAKKAIRKLEEDGTPRSNIVMVAGIGCGPKIFDYLAISGVYALHGRELSTGQGIKIANPDLKVIVFGGDGGIMGEGLEHLMFAAKRNIDITVVVHDNGVYGLTTGQFTPLSTKGFKGRSTPRGSIEVPFNPLTLTMEAGASYVARGFTVKMDHLADLISGGVKHKGFSFVDALQPCHTFNNTYKLYSQITEVMEEVPGSKEAAIKLAMRKDKWPIGLFSKEDRPEYTDLLHDGKNPVKRKISRKKRLAAVKNLIK
jgi:2-oxoglutarate ferredoxin oxidoreductase subunit beta